MGWLQGVAQIGGALLGANQAGHAADAQGDAARAQMDWIKSVYGDAQGNFAPYLGAGQQGLNGLSALMAGDYSGFENSPDYLYNRGQMVQGMDRSAAGHMRLNSGAYPLELAGHLNGLASQNLGQYRNSLFGLAGMGQQAAGSLGSIGSGTMGAMGQANGAYGDAQANRYGANAGAIGSIGNAIGGMFGGQSFGSSYGGGSNASNFGLPAPVNPYANTNYGNNPWGTG